MRISAESKNDGVILHLNGKVIGDSVAQLGQTIEEQMGQETGWLIVDLAEVPLMDSSALGTVIAAFLKLRDRNGKLVLVNARKSIRDVLAITKLDSLFEVHDDVQAALESVRSESP